MKEPSDLERQFMFYWKLFASDLPEPVREHMGLKPRRFRFDFCWPDHLLVVEAQGGVWTHGRHSRGKGQTNDYIKHNLATIKGYRIFYVTAGMLRDDPAGFIGQIRALLSTGAEASQEPGVTVRAA